MAYKCAVCGGYTGEPVHCGVPARPLMGEGERIALGKLLSGMLRHFPHRLGISLDREGWADLDDVARAVSRRQGYSWATREHVLAVAALDEKGRFEVDGGRIRARYGHSVPVDIRYPCDNEVGVLYHGTTAANLPGILAEGLRPGRRLYVHLSPAPEVAMEVGRRHGRDVAVLRVDAECLRRRGVRIYRATPSVYLAERVDAECLSVYVPPAGEGAGRRGAPAERRA